MICSGPGQIDSGRHNAGALRQSQKGKEEEEEENVWRLETKLWSLQAIINADGILHERDPIDSAARLQKGKKKIEAKEKSWEASLSLWRKIASSSSSSLDKVDYSRLLSRI